MILKRYFRAVLIILVSWGGPVMAGESRLADIDARFTASETPLYMEYDVGYRLLHLELARVGKIVASTTIGTWRHRVTGESIPALFLDMKVDSPDSGKTGERNRVSIHDRIIAVMTLPEMKALVFAKVTDEYLHPLIGRNKDALIVSVYDAQAGRMSYSTCNLQTGVSSTNLANPEALFDLSQRIKPVMDFLVSQHREGAKAGAASGQGRIVANLDGKVVALQILTKPDQSPACFGRLHFDTTRIVPVAAPGSSVKPREFHAWSLDFKKLAALRKDEALIKAAQEAPIESIVPLVMDYELGLGCVRTTMTAIYMGAAASPPAPLVLSKGPKPVAQENSNTH
ncbi:MAG: hypothetical protein WCI03_00210 [bacterium]